jgi:transketolase
MTSTDELTAISRRIRARLVRMSHETGAAHLGSSLSCVDLLVAAWWGFVNFDPARPDDPDRDRFLLSKGHAAAALYATLAERGVIPESLLATFALDGGQLPEQMSPGCAPGVEAATGSLGHGLPLAAGMALAGRLQGRPYRVCAILSDGDCNEGSVWEAALFAAARKIDSLVALVDFNGWQATGRTDDILALSPLREKFAAFGWHAADVDGHDLAALTDRLRRVPEIPGKPTVLVARTVKGKGVSFMEDDNNWHYRIPNADELQAALLELRPEHAGA